MPGFACDYVKDSSKEMAALFVKEEKLSEEDLPDIIREIENGKTDGNSFFENQRDLDATLRFL